jgi:hypothetical protein
MKAQIFATATLLTAFSTALPAVDSQLLNLVMPDAKVLAGVNVAQAKSSPFGQYVLSQMTTNTDVQQLFTLTGFDPRRDVNELLLASTAAPGNHAGLATATGTFDVNSIVSFATSKGAKTETFGGVTILEDPGQTHGVAFLSGSLVAAGDIASVKAAIGRVAQPSILPAAVVTQVNQLSAADDAWALTTVPPASLTPGATAPTVPGLGNGLQNSLGSVQSVSGGVKFGATVSFTAQAQTDTAQNATALAGVVQFLANMAQMQAASQNPQAAAALQSLTATASGTTVTVNLSVPEDQFQQLVRSGPNAAHPHQHGPARKQLH